MVPKAAGAQRRAPRATTLLIAPGKTPAGAASVVVRRTARLAQASQCFRVLARECEPVQLGKRSACPHQCAVRLSGCVLRRAVLLRGQVAPPHACEAGDALNVATRASAAARARAPPSALCARDGAYERRPLVVRTRVVPWSAWRRWARR